MGTEPDDSTSTIGTLGLVPCADFTTLHGKERPGQGETMKDLHKSLKREIEIHLGDLAAHSTEYRAFIEAVNEVYWQKDPRENGAHPAEGPGSHGTQVTALEGREAVIRPEAFYRTVFENTGTAAIVADGEGTILLANSSFERLSGYSRGELEGRHKWTSFFPEESLHEPSRHETDQEGGAIRPLTYECEFTDRQGARRKCVNSVSMIPGTRMTVTSVLELTDVLSLQKQLVHAQKMEAIGTLAAGIAHDFNNLLTGIQGNASLMLLEAGDNTRFRERLVGIEEHVRRGAELTKQLLSFAQTGRYQAKPISLNEIVEKTAAMFGRTKREIVIHKSFDDDLWTVEADQVEIERLLLNLFVNAAQAMPGGGQLYLTTSNVTLSQRYVQPFDLPAGRYVKVSTTDTGVGMDEQTKARIFEPFFTTRETGQGTGLGLASAYAIVKGHGGIINVYSEKGRGTTFTIYLPASSKEKESESLAASEQELRGSETILLVDDEPSIIDVGSQLLELLGYKVFTAASGVEAVEIFHRRHSEIHLVILDMIMPHMSGGETFDMLKAINPGVIVVLSSGYSMTGEAGSVVAKGCKGFIQKPFTPAELSRIIREALKKE